MANAVYISPSGNAEVWEIGTQPQGYVTPEQWNAGQTSGISLADTQNQKLAALLAACENAAAQGITYNTGTTGTAVRLLMDSNFDATYDATAKTLTQTAVASLETDGVDPVYNDRILLTGQTDATQNGIYTVTELGGAASNGLATLTLASDTLTAGEIIPVTDGTKYGGTSWQVNGDAWTKYAPAQVATDLVSRANMTAAVSMCNADGTLPSPWKAGPAWITISTKDDLMKLAKAMYGWVEACYAQLEALGAQVTATTTVSGVQAIVWADPKEGA